MILLRINAQIGKKQRAPTETFMHFALASPVITYVKLSMYTAEHIGFQMSHLYSSSQNIFLFCLSQKQLEEYLTL